MSAESEMVEAIRAAIGAHGVWKLRLKTAISLGRSEFSADEACHDDRCEFGKWLKGAAIPNAVRQSPQFKDISRRHGEFHRSAGYILGLALSGHKAEATAKLDGDFTNLSQGLTMAMRQWSQALTTGKAA